MMNSFTPAVDDRVMLSYQDGSMVNLEGERTFCYMLPNGRYPDVWPEVDNRTGVKQRHDGDLVQVGVCTLPLGPNHHHVFVLSLFS